MHHERASDNLPGCDGEEYEHGKLRHRPDSRVGDRRSHRSGRRCRWRLRHTDIGYSQSCPDLPAARARRDKRLLPGSIEAADDPKHNESVYIQVIGEVSSHPGGTLARSARFVELLELVIDVIQIAGVGGGIVRRGRRFVRDK